MATFALDVADQHSVDAAVAQAVARFGQIDVLINNAGYGLFGPFETAAQEVIERQFQTNVFGVFAVTRAVLPHMRERASGVIINVASLTGLVAMPLCGVQIRGGGVFRIAQPRIGATGHPREGVCARSGGDRLFGPFVGAHL